MLASLGRDAQSSGQNGRHRRPGYWHDEPMTSRQRGDGPDAHRRTRPPRPRRGPEAGRRPRDRPAPPQGPRRPARAARCPPASRATSTSSCAPPTCTRSSRHSSRSASSSAPTSPPGPSSPTPPTGGTTAGAGSTCTCRGRASRSTPSAPSTSCRATASSTRSPTGLPGPRAAPPSGSSWCSTPPGPGGDHRRRGRLDRRRPRGAGGGPPARRPSSAPRWRSPPASASSSCTAAAPTYALWHHFVHGGSRFDEWRARLTAAPGARAKAELLDSAFAGQPRPPADGARSRADAAGDPRAPAAAAAARGRRALAAGGAPMTHYRIADDVAWVSHEELDADGCPSAYVTRLPQGPPTTLEGSGCVVWLALADGGTRTRSLRRPPDVGRRARGHQGDVRGARRAAGRDRRSRRPADDDRTDQRTEGVGRDVAPAAVALEPAPLHQLDRPTTRASGQRARPTTRRAAVASASSTPNGTNSRTLSSTP